MQLGRGFSWLSETGVARKGKSPYAWVFPVFNFVCRQTIYIRAHLHTILDTSAMWSTWIRSRSGIPSCILSKELLLLSVLKSPATQSPQFRASLGDFIIHSRSCSITPELEKPTQKSTWDDSWKHHELLLSLQRCFDLGFLANVSNTSIQWGKKLRCCNTGIEWLRCKTYPG